MAIVDFSELGNCWLPARFHNNCLPCGRYATCTYPERQWHIEYERNRRARSLLAGQIARLDAEAHKLTG